MKPGLGVSWNTNTPLEVPLISRFNVFFAPVTMSPDEFIAIIIWDILKIETILQLFFVVGFFPRIRLQLYKTFTLVPSGDHGGLGSVQFHAVLVLNMRESPNIN